MANDVLPLVRTQWRIEALGTGKRWRQIGFPKTLAEAHSLFERALREYPSDRLVRAGRW